YAKGQQDTGTATDDSGRTIVALLQKAADMANEDCKRAMDLAHKLSFQLRGIRRTSEGSRGRGRAFSRSRRARRGMARAHPQRSRANVLPQERARPPQHVAAMTWRPSDDPFERRVVMPGFGYDQPGPPLA